MKYAKENLELDKALEREWIITNGIGLGEKIIVQKDKTGISENAISILKDGIELYMPLEDLVDMEEERKRLEEEKTKLVKSEESNCLISIMT